MSTENKSITKISRNRCHRLCGKVKSTLTNLLVLVYHGLKGHVLSNSFSAVVLPIKRHLQKFTAKIVDHFEWCICCYNSRGMATWNMFHTLSFSFHRRLSYFMEVRFPETVRAVKPHGTEHFFYCFSSSRHKCHLSLF